jgi:hypothetical protein
MSSFKSERYSFPAVAIETSAKYSKQVREAFFSQPKPTDATKEFPYTGPYQFVPALQLKEWPITKIFQPAKVLVKICQNLKVIYIENLQDIQNVIGDEGQTLMRSFLNLTHMVNNSPHPLIQSVHNTGRTNVKAVLVPMENYDAAMDQLGSLHQLLLAGVSKDYYEAVFVGNSEAGMTSGHRDTIQLCNSSQSATELLQLFNPQDAEAESLDTNLKRFRPTMISYAAAASSSTSAVASSSHSTAITYSPSDTQPTKVSSLTLR